MKWWNRGWNPILGCTKCSEGCKFCYAEQNVQKRLKSERNLTFDVRVNEKQLRKVFDGSPEFVFVCSQSDLFHHSVSEKTIDRVFEKIAECPQKKFAVCTKRSAYMREYFSNYDLPVKSYSNVIFGVTVESNRYKSRIEDLMDADYIKYRFLSIEPMLEAIDLNDYLKTNLIDWVVVGCESGENARPCKREWIEGVVQQCKENAVPVFVNNINVDGQVTDNLAGSGIDCREFFGNFKPAV